MYHDAFFKFSYGVKPTGLHKNTMMLGKSWCINMDKLNKQKYSKQQLITF